MRRYVGVLLAIAVLGWSSPLVSAQASAESHPLPYRFLLVISDQWADPASHVIDQEDDFQTIAALLKTWGLPFEIMRLDQQRMDMYHILDREGRPRYGTIIWNAGADKLDGKGTELLETLVKQHGVGLVALGDSVAAPVVAELAGLEYVSQYRLGDGLEIGREHFITRGLKEREKEFHQGRSAIPGSKTVLRGATELAKRGHLPFLTVRAHGAGGRVVWLGAQRSAAQLQKQIVRDLLKRCLVWTQGYALYAEYARSILLLMDDIGTSDRTYLPYWHYRTLDENDIRKGLIEPLKRHNAVMMQDVITGYVDRKNRRIVSPWKLRIIDEIDGKTVHDYVSAKRGLDAGIREGVFEITSHGWTHMLPDMDSPPGPFWDAPMDGVGTLGWDTEFGDRLRGKEIPAILQRYHLERSIEDLQEDFGVTPLFVIAGGGGHSRSLPNHSQRIAAQLGFGLSSDFGSVGYLGRDFVITMQPIVQRRSWGHDREVDAAGIPWTIDAPYFMIFHDRDVAMDISSVDRLLRELGDVRYMTANEYCAYLHAGIERAAKSQESLALAISYDAHYCRYFASHPSTWTLHVSDEVRRALPGSVPEKRVVRIPKGLGPHLVRLDSGLVTGSP